MDYIKYFFASLTLILILSLSPYADATNNPREVYSIKEINLSILESFPPQLHISALGTVTTSGWTNGALIPRLYITPPANGIYEFDFEATPPKNISLQVLMPISASYIMPDIPLNLKGVKVYTKTNSMTAEISGKTPKIKNKPPQ